MKLETALIALYYHYHYHYHFKPAQGIFLPPASA